MRSIAETYERRKGNKVKDLEETPHNGKGKKKYEWAGFRDCHCI